MKIKKIFTYHRLLRYSSFLFFMSAFFACFFIDSPRAGEYAAALVISADVLLLLYPLPSQSLRVSLMWAGVYVLSTCALVLTGVPMEMLLPVCCTFPLTYVLFRSHVRFCKAKSLFCANNIIFFVREFAHLFYSALLFMLVAAVLGCWNIAGYWILLLPAGFFVPLYYRAYTTRTLFISPAREREIYEISRGQIRTIAGGSCVNDARMESIYAKAVDLMENEKVYLEPSYSIYDLAQQTGTNKSYISRVVNLYSGQNFCRFLNWYRVRYAAAYANENPSVKVTELALKSGFNSNVTFNTAFKLYMGYSPGEYLQRISRIEGNNP